MDWHLIWSLVSAILWMFLITIPTVTAIFILTGGEGLGGRKRGKKK